MVRENIYYKIDIAKIENVNSDVNLLKIAYPGVIQYITFDISIYIILAQYLKI